MKLRRIKKVANKAVKKGRGIDSGKIVVDHDGQWSKWVRQRCRMRSAERAFRDFKHLWGSSYRFRLYLTLKTPLPESVKALMFEDGP